MYRVLIFFSSAAILSMGFASGKNPDPSQVPVDCLGCDGGYVPSEEWVKESVVKWDPAKEKPPLSLEGAEKIGCAMLEEHLKSLKPIRVDVESTRLVKTRGGWAYTIGLSFIWKGVAFVGAPFRACVHVRMDGTAIVERSFWIRFFLEERSNGEGSDAR